MIYDLYYRLLFHTVCRVIGHDTSWTSICNRCIAIKMNGKWVSR